MSFYNGLFRAFGKEQIQQLAGVQALGQLVMTAMNFYRFLLFLLVFFIKKNFFLIFIENLIHVFGKSSRSGNRL
jgi:hypothetical protein